MFFFSFQKCNKEEPDFYNSESFVVGKKIMGYGSKIVHMMIVIIFLLVSLNSYHILIAAAAAADGLESGGSWQQNKIEKVSGQDENDKKEALIVQKFRALLGLGSSTKRRTPLNGGGAEFSSPSPSPSPEATVPSPAPALPPTVAHLHPPPHHSSAPPHIIHKETTGGGGVRRVLVPVIVSATAAFMACLVGLICFCGKTRKYRKKSTKTILTYYKKGRIKGKSKHKTGQNSSSKVSLNPGLDLFYLNSLGMDLVQQQQQQPSAETEKKSPNHSTLESDNASSSSTREIKSVHEDIASARYDDSDEKIPMELEYCHSSDDESFHSFVDSHSSNPRFSNASAGSLTDTPEIPLNVTKMSRPAATTALQPQSPCSSQYSPDCQKNFTPPPPPPPPPPSLPPVVRISPIHSSLSGTRARFKASGSSDSSLPSPPGIPPPPCPPPFLKGSPHRPPTLLPQYTPLGKNGAPLPKLKPLHWDKVRAAPDRSTVWDKMRSSSFEYVVFVFLSVHLIHIS